ncbi:MAG: ParB/RepB/Spo0J family partition protein [Pseudomonadota bacterium]
MSRRRKGLGRGLDALLGGGADGPADVLCAEPGGDEYRLLPVEMLRRGRYQPRRDMNPEALQQLADSIRSQGLMQPLVVRRLADGDYEIIAGERRWRAAQLAGIDRVPVLIREVGDEAALALALIENIQREDLNAMEESIALMRLQEEFGLSQQQVAAAVGKSRAAVANLMRLVKLEPEVQELLLRGDLEMGHARALLALEGGDQIAAARRVVAVGATVRQTETLVHSWHRSRTEKSPAQRDPDIERLEEDLGSRLGTRVELRSRRKGGHLIIHYTDLDVLEGILERIR